MQLENAVKVLCLLRKFHDTGFQRMRFVPGLSPSGAYWRCAITAKSNLDRFDLHRLKSNALVANYSSAQGNELFGMAHSANDPIDRLAIRFASTYPQIVDVCNGADPLYADWLAELQAHAESKLLPVAYADGLTYSRDSVALLDECGAVRSLCPLKFD